MSAFLTVVHVIVCLILILVILLQAGRGQGLAGPALGSGNVQSLLGTRAADFLTKATSVAAICFLFTSIGLNFLEIQKSRSLLQGPRQASTIDVETLKKALEEAKQKGALQENKEAATQPPDSANTDQKSAEESPPKTAES